MKKLSRVLVLVLSAVMVLAMSASVFAADDDASITINPGSDATGTVNTEYTYYQLFHASISGEDGERVSYYLESPDEDTLKGLLDAVTVGEVDLFTFTKSADGTRWNVTINKKSETEDFTDADGEAIANALATNAIKAAAIDHGDFAQNDGSAVAENLERGYYLVTSTLGTKLVLQTLNNVEIETKNNYPTTTKAASKKNMEVGSKVTYTITVNIPETAIAGDVFTVHDTLDNHLAIVGDVTAKAGSATVTLTDATAASGETFAKSFTLTDTIISAKSVVITYDAELFSTATADTGYENSAYTHTPAYDTLPAVVEVYTFDFELDKTFVGATDDESGSLEATFELYGADEAAIQFVKNGTTYVKADSDDTGASATITIKGNEVININGLAAGTYTLKEKTTADGYNLLTEPKTVTIADTSTDTAISHTVNGVADTNPVVIENNSGTVLPTTGGIGTTIFYIVGAALVIGCGIVLISRKRMQK